jgi:hypothetical protein
MRGGPRMASAKPLHDGGLSGVDRCSLMAGAGGRWRWARRIVTVEKTEAQKWSGHAFALPIGVLSSAPEASVDEGVNGRAAKCQRAPPSG